MTAFAEKDHNDCLDKRELFLLLSILVLAFVLRLAFLHEPFDRDEGFYGYIGQEILRGSLPYRDVVDIKPPGVYYIYAGMIALVGGTTEALRIVTAFFAVITVLFIHMLARQAYGTRTGLLAALLYGIYSSGPLHYGSSSNAEVFMVLPLVLGTYLALKGADATRGRLFFAGSGLCAGIAMLVKTVALPHVLLLFFFVLLYRKPDDMLKRRLVDAGIFALPLLLLAVLTLAYFTTHRALDDFIYWNFTFIKKYSKSNIVGMSFLRTVGDIAPETVPLALLALPVSFWLIFGRKSDYRDRLIGLLLPVSFVGVCMPGKFYPHYFIQLVPSLALLAAIALDRIMRSRRFLYAAAPLLLAMFAYTAAKEYRYYLVYDPREISMKKYGSSLFVDSVDVAKYIRERTEPSDYIYQWGFEPEIYFLSGRRSPFKHITPVLMVDAGNPGKEYMDLMSSIMRKRPKFIILQPRYVPLDGTSELRNIIQRSYRLDYITAEEVVYRLGT